MTCIRRRCRFSHGILEMPLTTLEIRCSTGVYLFLRILFSFHSETCTVCVIIIFTLGFLGGLTMHSTTCQRSIQSHGTKCFAFVLVCFHSAG
ncbi:uncharacterized protein P174DRAFT_257985 [Aspergillus novofumigatus IBT 16806]|uniref:Uncharacterized protein n=1 Tax=Aspergillus novofumigatus (strain IBT 16806) TaxID=1392255 RepID=A0A2I1C358_ASPN1|nr:uncharacterized protein P174DRAFT_257985 [Aspergillus novofumigatus IBT 16806]PKX92043.1 hypothetical protein P174DRAFT_257985 [Aspergillus novofumigatus IBT 16806]